jgi:hypothetical protein
VATSGTANRSMGQYTKAIALIEEDKAIAEEVGDQAGVGRACVSLASVTSAKSGHLWRERHKDLCRLLKKRRQVKAARLLTRVLRRCWHS